MEDTLSNQPDHAGPAGEEPISIEDGALALEGLLEPEDSDNSGSDPKAKQEEEVTNEADEQPKDDEDSDADEDTTDEGETETDEGAEESQEAKTDGDEPLSYADDVVVEFNGQETTLGEIVNERVQERQKQYQADYTRKTQELAQENRSFDERVNRLNEVTQNAVRQQETFLEFQKQFAPETPDIGLVETDPIEYQRQKAYHDQWHETYQNFANQYDQSQQQRQQEFVQSQQQVLALEKQKMVELVPELGTEEGMKTFKKDLSEIFSPTYGYSAEELGMVQDSRFAPIAKDAMAWRKLQDKKPEVQKKLQGKPPVLKPKARKSSNAKMTAIKARQERLAKYGDIDDAVAIIESML